MGLLVGANFGRWHERNYGDTIADCRRQLAIAPTCVERKFPHGEPVTTVYPPTYECKRDGLGRWVCGVAR
jgi:hypothetical protein